MSEKVEVRGDVAQLISGNVHEAPQQNNVVNFNVGNDKGPVQTLTDLQRKRIAGLVRELCAITQEETLNVYRVILTEFGAERMRDMPRESYHDVVALIDRWIAENSPASYTMQPIASVSSETASKQDVEVLHPKCDICFEKDISYSRLQKLSRGQWVLSAALAFTCGTLLYKIPPQDDPLSFEERYCFFHGKPFTFGSTVTLPTGDLRECSYDGELKKMVWVKTQ